MQSEIVGKVQTVLGSVDGSSLGITLIHEHFLHDSTCYCVEPTSDIEKALVHQPVSLKNLNLVLYNLRCNLDDYRWEDEQLIIKELIPFKSAGGKTIVEQSVRGMAANPEAAMRISRATGINVIKATGYYVAISHPTSVASMTEEEIAESLVRDIEVGMDNTNIRAGLLKAACGGPGSVKVEENECKIMRACALAQRHTGAAMGVHIMQPELSLDVIDILCNAGADLNRCIIYHTDRWGSDPLILPRLLQAGCYIGIDGFGTDERGIAPGANYAAYRINDTQRCAMIVRLITQGYLKHILISQDVWKKNNHTTYGGTGYDHILLHTVPLMHHMGISDEQISTMMVENPKRVLTFAPAKENKRGHIFRSQF